MYFKNTSQFALILWASIIPYVSAQQDQMDCPTTMENIVLKGKAIPSISYNSIDDPNLYEYMLTKIHPKIQIAMFGEQHWMNKIIMFKYNIVEKLASERQFKNVVLEFPYSYTGFLNEYINKKVGQGDEILETVKYTFDTEEEIDFLKKVQRWNSQNPKNKITILCFDFEQDYTFPFINVILPFFKEFGDTTVFEYIKAKQNVDDTLLHRMDSVMKNVPEGFTLNKFKFIDKRYVSNTIENIRTAYQGQKQIELMGETNGFEYFMKIRTEQIKSNLFDKNIFGKQITNEKSIFWAGANHVRYLDDQDAIKNPNEGNYFRNKFKNKVVSFNVSVLGYNINEAYYDHDVETNLTSYKGLIDWYKECYPNKIQNKYLLVELLDDVTSWLLNNLNLLNKDCVIFEGKTNKTIASFNHEYNKYLQFDYNLLIKEATLYKKLD